MSRIPTHLPPPSFHGWYYRYPATDLIKQYRPVYYSSGITPTHFRQLQTAHRERIATCRKTLEAERLAAIAAASKATAAATSNNSNNARPLIEAAIQLAATGQTSESSPLFLTLHQAGKLTALDYCRYISSLAAPSVFSSLHGGDANFDRALTYKMMGDFGGNARAQEALSAFEMAANSLSASSSSSSSSQPINRIIFYNALMQTLLTCGFDHVKRVSGDVYDSIGVASLNPTAATYKNVMLSLSLLANPTEANHIMTFLRSKRADQIDTAMFNNLMLGYRESREFDRVDEIWTELVDRRVPMPNVESAEEQIRSIVELSNTPLTEPALQFRNQLNVVERKRIPIVLHQMEQLGIMRCALCPPVLHEVESALRQFSIYRGRFYEWGRAVRIFDFVEYRRKHGWLYDLQDINIPLKNGPTLRPYGTDGTTNIAPFASEALPSYLTDRPTWEQQPLAHIFNKITTEEYMEDSRAGGDKYKTNVKSIHERDPAWRNRVPQTRYDTLYGVSSPSMPAVGVRRHLAGTESSALGTDEYQSQRDNSIVRRSLSKARRARQMVERARTHRAAASLE